MKKNIKLHSLLCVLLVLFLGVTDVKAAHSRWDYDIQYRGMVTSDLTIEIIGDTTACKKECCLIRCETHNNGVYQRLFRVENKYETQLIPSQKGLPLYLKKTINQKNIQQEWKISYDHSRGNAAIDSQYIWQIPSNCHNYFSMLVFLQKQPLTIGDAYQFALDTESKLWQVTAKVVGLEALELPCGRFIGSHLVLFFQPLNDAHVREWKTDLMTNRFANKKDKMHIWIANSVERKILRINYNSKTKMRLRSVTNY